MVFRKITAQSPLRLPLGDYVIGIVFHWTAARYGQPFPDYQFCADSDGTIYQNEEADPGDTLPHTWKRNTGRVAIAAMAMYNATTDNYGKYPITPKQIEAMAALAAKIAKRYGVKPDEIKTHYDWAEIDGYGPSTNCERWDLWKEGPALKKKVQWYLKKLSAPHGA
jgi:hypothetical protein